MDLVEEIQAAQSTLDNFNLKIAKFRAKHGLKPVTTWKEMYSLMGQLSELLRDLELKCRKADGDFEFIMDKFNKIQEQHNG